MNGKVSYYYDKRATSGLNYKSKKKTNKRPSKNITAFTTQSEKAHFRYLVVGVLVE